MTKDGFSRLGGLLKSSGIGAMAAALAMMALPAEAFAQDHGGGHRWRGGQGSTQVQGNSGGGQRGGGGGGWNGGGSAQTQNNGGGSRGGGAVQTPRGGGGGWNGGGAVHTPRDGGRRGDGAAQSPRGGSWRGDGAVQTAPRGEHRGWRDGSRNWQGGGGNDSARRDGGWRNRDGDGHRNWGNRDNHRRDGHRNWGNRDNHWRGDNWRDGNRNWRGRDRHGYSNDYRRWDRKWRNDNRYNWRHHRSRNHNTYRIGRYYAPYNDYYYSRLSVGFFLDSLFYSSNYWISDPGLYRRPAADGPYRWIRYYDDALLVDVYTGEVVDVIYDFFW